jgi:methylenetetrahydrofolate dehydrogenase (NADP+)/methenyltetrahydrofolate cyclohydrolase
LDYIYYHNDPVNYEFVMPAKIIDGKEIAGQIRQEVAEESKALKDTGITPGLGFILVGNDPASRAYVKSKGKACEQVGFYSLTKELPVTTTQAELMAWVHQFNRDPAIHGFLVQLPLPEGLDETQVIEAVDSSKDVDCFHPYNVGRLPLGTEAFAPCTPAGIVELLIRSGNDPRGKHAVILGRSSIVGRPLSILLSRKGRGGDATVTVCHSRTPDLAHFTRQADILVAAMGKAEFVHGDMIKPGAVVIDVGINRVDDPSVEGKGYRLTGDVDFASAQQVAGAITPVPGGVGPMTIAMLLKNTLRAAKVKAGNAG